MVICWELKTAMEMKAFESINFLVTFTTFIC